MPTLQPTPAPKSDKPGTPAAAPKPPSGSSKGTDPKAPVVFKDFASI